jgi:hypothetical protein
MLKEVQLTHGIGVRIAHNILRLSIKDALIDQVLTFVTNANQRKKKGHVGHTKQTIAIYTSKRNQT